MTNTHLFPELQVTQQVSRASIAHVRNPLMVTVWSGRHKVLEIKVEIKIISKTVFFEALSGVKNFSHISLLLLLCYKPRQINVLW